MRYPPDDTRKICLLCSFLSLSLNTNSHLFFPKLNTFSSHPIQSAYPHPLFPCPRPPIIGQEELAWQRHVFITTSTCTAQRSCIQTARLISFAFIYQSESISRINVFSVNDGRFWSCACAKMRSGGKRSWAEFPNLESSLLPPHPAPIPSFLSSLYGNHENIYKAYPYRRGNTFTSMCIHAYTWW